MCVGGGGVFVCLFVCFVLFCFCVLDQSVKSY